MKVMMKYFIGELFLFSNMCHQLIGAFDFLNGIELNYRCYDY